MAHGGMEEKIRRMLARYHQVETEIADPNIAKDAKRYREIMREHSQLAEVSHTHGELEKAEQELAETRELLETEKDHAVRDMAREELHSLEQKVEDLTSALRVLLIPKDPMDEKNAIMEIRAGTGGDEAGLFAADLFRMYSRYAEKKRWKVEIMSSSASEIGGFKEIVFSIAGAGVYGELKFESGVHRVQRVPETESSGRIHTSAVTVAVLPEVEETDIHVSPEELRVDVYRSSGPGGQSVNTTDSAVRLTHLPTGLVVICQDEKSQHKNKAKALRVLMARLYEIEEEKKQSERATERRSQIGSGDRSERIRTYNFPQSRITDHRINLTLYKLEAVLQGELDEIINGLKVTEREAALSGIE